MSWVSTNAGVLDADWGLINFARGKTESFTVARPSVGAAAAAAATDESHCEDGVANTVLYKDQSLRGFLEQVQELKHHDDFGRINLVLGDRMRGLKQFPFERKYFVQMMRDFRIHGSIVRFINRSTSCAFSVLPMNWNHQDPSSAYIVYNCRTAGSWAGDMVLSAAFCPFTLTTNAIWLGCDLTERDIYGFRLQDADIISGRLSRFDGSSLHPMILPTLFADFERDRHAKLVRGNTSQVVERLCRLVSMDTNTDGSEHQDNITESSDDSFRSSIKTSIRNLINKIRWKGDSTVETIELADSDASTTNTSSLPVDDQPSVMLWLNLSHVRGGLENWKAKLLKMIEHVDELNDASFWASNPSKIPEWDQKLAALTESGGRIKRRLQDLVHEYDEFIRECTQAIEGMALANQLELNSISQKDAKTNSEISRINLKVAKMTRRDGNLMRCIAILGMVFLPASFASSFFSMDFFQWPKRSAADLVSPYVWVYAAVAASLTLLTVGAFCIMDWKWGRAKQLDSEV